MERYHTLFWVTILGPLILGLIALALVVLPGEPNTGRMVIGLAVYLVIAIVGGIVITRRFDR
jgi:hypothetical protein